MQLRIRPENWSRVRNDLQLIWAESAREVCLRNLGPINSASRLSPDAADAPASAARRAFGAHYVCPCGGEYHAQQTTNGDPAVIVCSIHGDAAHPQQATTVPDASTAAKVTSTLGDITASLTFTEHGLQAVFKVHRHPTSKK